MLSAMPSSVRICFPASGWVRAVARGAGWCVVAVMALLTGCVTPPPPEPIASVTSPAALTRVSSAVPFPRGLALKDSALYALSRGKVRDAGGTDNRIDDHAGTIYAVDPDAASPLDTDVSPEVDRNARPIAAPTDPPFRMLRSDLPDALADTRTDRPYCILRYDPATSSFYFCAFSGIDKPLSQYGGKNDRSYFRKNNSDAVFRFDTRTRRYHLLYRGPLALSGPNNCLVVGDRLYVVAKENSTLWRFDISRFRDNPDAPPPPAEYVLGDTFDVDGLGKQRYFGHSMLAKDGEYLYLGFRTSSVIVRLRLEDVASLPRYDPRHPHIPRAQLIARFDPFDPETGATADLTDMTYAPPASPGESGSLVVISAKPARLYRFHPSPDHVFDARSASPDGPPPYADLSVLTANPKMKAEAVLVAPDGSIYVTSADRAPGSALEKGLAGTIYRLSPGPRATTTSPVRAPSPGPGTVPTPFKRIGRPL